MSNVEHITDFDFVFETSRQVGLGKGFNPTPTGTSVRFAKHPPGKEGTTFSLQKMAEFIREGRNNFLVRGWAGKVLEAAGRPQTTRAKAQAILDAVRKQVVYEQDPVNTEMMVKPHITLCLDKNLCMPVGDCDDLVICVCSAIMSIGLECRVVGAAYGTERATHVLCAVMDESGKWLYIDPSSSTYPVGKAYPATKEWWMDPISGSIVEDGKKTTLGQEPTHGDFIGVGAVPVERALSPAPVTSAEPTGVGVVPFAHAFSSQAHGASYVPVGLEQGCPCFPDGKESFAARERAFSHGLAGLGLFEDGDDQ